VLAERAVGSDAATAAVDEELAVGGVPLVVDGEACGGGVVGREGERGGDDDAAEVDAPGHGRSPGVAGAGSGSGSGPASAARSPRRTGATTVRRSVPGAVGAPGSATSSSSVRPRTRAWHGPSSARLVSLTERVAREPVSSRTSRRRP